MSDAETKSEYWVMGDADGNYLTWSFGDDLYVQTNDLKEAETFSTRQDAECEIGRLGTAYDFDWGGGRIVPLKVTVTTTVKAEPAP